MHVSSKVHFHIPRESVRSLDHLCLVVNQYPAPSDTTLMHALWMQTILQQRPNSEQTIPDMCARQINGKKDANLKKDFLLSDTAT